MRRLLIPIVVIGGIAAGLYTARITADAITQAFPTPVAVYVMACLVLSLALQDDWILRLVRERNRWLLHATSAVLLLGGVVGPLIRGLSL